MAEFYSDYLTYYYPQSLKQKTIEASISASLQSHLYFKPDNKSHQEIFTSLKAGLTAKGFTLDSYSDNQAKTLARLYLGQKKNNIAGRPYTTNSEQYRQTTLKKIKNFSRHLLIASQQQDKKTAVVVIAISDSGFYLVDHLTSTAMEQDTALISEQVFNNAMDSQGKFLVYDIHFDINSAAIRSGSAKALAIIANYINSHPQDTFYIVGHTDDTGDRQHNMKLSKQRAEAVSQSLIQQYALKPDQLFSYGVGPVSPVATNQSQTGRSKNRRVEIVKRYRK